MKVRDLIKIFMDECKLDDDILITAGSKRDFDKYNTEYNGNIEWCYESKTLYLFADFRVKIEKEEI